jgi:hypothetical protein
MTKNKLDYEPSHKMDGKYAILMETSGEENESWMYFIRVEGNEENLKHLETELNKVDWYILDDLSTFDLDLSHYVSAQTAKEMSKVDLNHTSFHRKFDGVLKKINLNFKKKDGNDTKICKTFDILGYGQIENFIDDEDIDEEDLVSENDDDSEDEDDDDEDADDDDEDADEDDDDEDDDEDAEDKEDDKVEEIKKKKINVKIPPSLKQ